jgi:hypothetical protein
MGEQQSQKRGVRSDAQKQAGARQGYDPTPSTSRAEGAFGKQKKTRQTDRDLALAQAQKSKRAAKE